MRHAPSNIQYHPLKNISVLNPYAYLHYCALIVARHFALYFLKEAPGQLHLNWVYEECRKSTFFTALDAPCGNRCFEAVVCCRRSQGEEP